MKFATVAGTGDWHRLVRYSCRPEVTRSSPTGAANQALPTEAALQPARRCSPSSLNVSQTP